MANSQHVQIVQSGREALSAWRKANKSTQLDLSLANLSGADLIKADLSGANLFQANLTGADLLRADLSGADLRGGADLSGAKLDKANLTGTNLWMAKLSEVNLRGANLHGANLTGANLRGAGLSAADLSKADLSLANLRGADLVGADLSLANLRGADLVGANLVEANLDRAYLGRTNLIGANLSGANLRSAQLIDCCLKGAVMDGCNIYGVSVWDIAVDDHTSQRNLVITDRGQPEVTVDNLKVAQFIHLLLDNVEVRQVIDSITSKGVLILGRFSNARKPVLDALREELRQRNYLPILFDFPETENQTTMETVRTLAGMSKFVVADLTDGRSVPAELYSLVPDMNSLAFMFIAEKGSEVHGQINGLKRNRTNVVETVFEYDSQEHLLASLAGGVIAPAEAKSEQLRKKP